MHLPILVLLTCGLRRGELLALRWQDLELDRGIMIVRRGMIKTRTAGVALRNPRVVKREPRITGLVVDSLRAHRETQEAERRVFGVGYVDHDLVFAAFDGKPWKPDSFTQLFRRTVKYAKLPNMRTHTLRRTAATFMARQGVNPKVASARLGHSTVRLTLDVYSEVAPDMQEDAASIMDQTIRSGMRMLRENGGRMVAWGGKGPSPGSDHSDKPLHNKALDGGRERSRTSDLYSVNVALYR